MRVPAVRLPWLSVAQLVLLACLPALSLSGAPGAAAPLVLALLVAAVALAVATAVDAPALAVEVTSCPALAETRSPARQGDPDAAGHIRPRAPGLPRAPAKSWLT